MITRPMFYSWRFLYPGLDAPEEAAGLRFTQRGSIAMVDGAAAIRQALLLLISTRPGERVMRPDYGCLLHKLLFAPNDGTTAGLAIHYVQQAVTRWEPRIDIVSLDANRDAEQGTNLNILLEYRIKTTHQIDLLSFAMNLTGDIPGGGA